MSPALMKDADEQRARAGLPPMYSGMYPTFDVEDQRLISVGRESEAKAKAEDERQAKVRAELAAREAKAARKKAILGMRLGKAARRNMLKAEGLASDVVGDMLLENEAEILGFEMPDFLSYLDPIRNTFRKFTQVAVPDAVQPWMKDLSLIWDQYRARVQVDARRKARARAQTARMPRRRV
jgi:hypothetical protein